LDGSNPRTMEEMLEEFREGVKELRKKFGLRVSLPRVLAVLIEFPCPARCLAELKPKPQRPIDHFYLGRHEYIRRLLIAHLRLRLKKEGFDVSVRAENKGEYGTGDVDIEYNRTSVDLSIRSFKLRIEVKGGEGFAIDQVLRYLLDANAVILCLAGKGHAITISRSKVKPLLEFQLMIALENLKHLLDGDKSLLPGRWCTGCPVVCPYARPITSIKHEPDLNGEFVEKATKWRKAIEETVNQAVELLKKVRKTDEKLANHKRPNRRLEKPTPIGR